MIPLGHLSIVDNTLAVLCEGLVVTDVVYNQLLKHAEDAEAIVINGLGMML